MRALHLPHTADTDRRVIHLYFLAFVSVQSWAGHAEPSAGAISMLLTQQALAQRVNLPLLHLREMNPSAAAAVGGDSGGMQVSITTLTIVCSASYPSSFKITFTSTFEVRVILITRTSLLAMQVTRQLAPKPAVSHDDAAGVSAFAFQGENTL